MSPAPAFVYNPPMDPRIDVIHQDDALLVLNKQSGLLSVPGRPEEHKDCLESRVREVFPSALTVHRLDMSTSGVYVMAMTPNAQRHLGLQFERRHTAKTYIARIWGDLPEDEGEVDEPLICDWPNRPKQMICHENGKPAQTLWKRLSTKDGVTRVELTPITGRTHQLRVHMLHLGRPILGDELYAHEEARLAADRLQLHAQSLTIHHPNGGKRVTFEAPCPF